MSKFATLLREHLSARSISLSDVSRATGLSLPQLSRIVSGKQKFVSHQFVRAVAQAQASGIERQLVLAHLQDCARACGYQLVAAAVRHTASGQ